MTRLTLIKVSYTLHVVITKIIPNRFSQELCERNRKENLNPHTNINVETKHKKTNTNK